MHLFIWIYKPCSTISIKQWISIWHVSWFLYAGKKIPLVYMLTLWWSCFLKCSFKFSSKQWHGLEYNMLKFVGTWGRIIAETQMPIAAHGASPLTPVWDGSIATWSGVIMYKWHCQNLLKQHWNQILVRLLSTSPRNAHNQQDVFYRNVSKNLMRMKYRNI